MASGAYATAPAAAAALLHSVWQGALLALVGAVAFSGLARRRAAVRHTVGMVLLGGMVLLPIVTFALYRFSSPDAAWSTSPTVVPLVLRGSDWLAVVAPLAWLLGAAVMLLRQLGGWRLVRALERRAAAPPRPWLDRVEAVRQRLGIAREVSVRVGSGVSPFTARALRPVIWLPRALWDRLTTAQCDAVLAHELAHVRRLDWVWNGLQSTIEALLFFHPAVRWLSRRTRQEREHACDDLAVEACGDALALAEGLTALEYQRRSGAGLVLAAHGGSLLPRISRLLVGAPARVPLRLPIAMVLLLGAGVGLATQLEVPRDVLVNLRVEASAPGPLMPGTSREILAEGLAEQRRYRVRMDHRGHVSESYEEDGEPRPIDPSVRAWLAALPTD